MIIYYKETFRELICKGGSSVILMTIEKHVKKYSKWGFRNS
jgi:hypothetical protein